MHRVRLLVPFLAPTCAVLLAGCGGGETAAPTTTAAATGAGTPPTTATVPATLPSVPPGPKVTPNAPFRIKLITDGHHPVVNEPWFLRVVVTDAAGRPARGTLTMRVLFNGTPVGQIDDGKVYPFSGSWQERKGNEITWPPASVGQPLTLQVLVTVAGKTKAALWPLVVVPKRS